MLSVFVFAASRTNASSLAHIRHNISVCAQHARATTHATTSLNTHRSGERKRGRRVLFLFAKEEEDHEEEEEGHAFWYRGVECASLQFVRERRKLEKIVSKSFH